MRCAILIGTVLATAVLALFGLAACTPADDPPLDKPDPEPKAGWRLRALPDVDTAGARWGHIPAVASTGGTYFIGGTDIDLGTGEGVVLRDIWRVDVDGAAPVFSEVPGDRGEARYCGCAALDEERNELLVMGGRDQANVVIHDAWIFSLDDGSWTAVPGPLPNGMVGCGAVFIPGAGGAYVFGGGSDAFASSATLFFDTSARTFTELEVDGPSARFDHQLRPSSDYSHLWLVSGSLTGVTGFSPEVWRFDVDTETWSLVEVTGEQPPGRRTPWVAVRDDDTALVMGFGTEGLSPGSGLSDVWLLDLVAAQWTRLDVENNAGPRAFSYFLRAPAGGVGLVYGGTDMVHTLGDLYVLEGPDADVGWH